MIKKLPHIDELVASVIVALIVWGIGVSGLELVSIEEHAIAATGMSRIILLLAAPIFLGVMSYFLVKWSHGYKGPAELIVVLKEKSSQFPGWVKATTTWLIACVELGSGLSPKGFEGPYVAAAGGLSGFLATKMSLDSASRRRLARCGLGVAFGLLFRTPFGGFICTFEFGGFEKKEFWKQLPTAAIATVVNIWLMNTTKLPVPFKVLSLPSGITEHQLLLLLIVGISCGIAGLAYVHSIRLSKKIFLKLENNMALVYIPVIGATISTLLGAMFPVILGSNELSRILNSPLIPTMTIGAIVAKILATASADGSKLAGGTVGPAILLGGLIGKLVGGFNPIFAAAGSAAIIGPIAGIPFTMLLTVFTWLGFAPLAFVIIAPIAISKLVCWGTELYPYIPSLTKSWPKELN